MKRPLIETLFAASVPAQLEEAGFECATISNNPERVRVMKHNCAAVFEKQRDAQWRLSQAPGYWIRGEIARLWDAGYQKFWLLGPPTDEPFNEPRRPALAEQLRALHGFSEELKSALGIPSFYNESIGTTSEVTSYDRLKGRGSSTPTPSH